MKLEKLFYRFKRSAIRQSETLPAVHRCNSGCLFRRIGSAPEFCDFLWGKPRCCRLSSSGSMSCETTTQFPADVTAPGAPEAAATHRSDVIARRGVEREASGSAAGCAGRFSWILWWRALALFGEIFLFKWHTTEPAKALISWIWLLKLMSNFRRHHQVLKALKVAKWQLWNSFWNKAWHSEASRFLNYISEFY